MENDILLIVDEVQTGIGRTGTFLCCEQYHIRPNIITPAKGLGGGLPIDAVLMDEAAGEIFQPGQHGSAGGGAVSGLGLMIGVRLEERMDAKLVASRCAENGLMILTAKTKLRIMPPLNITMDEIDRGLNVLRGCLSGLGDRDETKKNKL